VIYLGKIEDAKTWFADNKWNQPEPNMCWTATLKMILDELANRHNDKSLKIGLKSINKICNYTKKFGPKMEIVVPAINNKVTDAGYIAKEIEGHDRFKELRDILFDDDTSLPIICFGPNYLKDQKGSSTTYTVPGAPEHYDHCVIVINIVDKIEIIDPFDAYLSEKTYIKNVIKSLTKPKFLYYWSNSGTPYWIMWIEKKIKENKTLDDWIQKENVEHEQPIIKRI
jgi:hypothetical protein